MLDRVKSLGRINLSKLKLELRFENGRQGSNCSETSGVPFRVVRADHLAVIVLSVGRAKYLTRILVLLESGSVSTEEIGRLAVRRGLAEEWRRFENRFLNE